MGTSTARGSRMARRWRTCAPSLLLMVLAVGNCAEPLAPEGAPTCSDPDDLVVCFEARPRMVRGGDALSAIITIHNTTADSATVSSGMSCVAHLTAYRYGEPVRMQGTGYLCLAVPRALLIGPRDSVAQVHALRAPARLGTYTLRATLNLSFRDIETHFRVVP